MSKNAKGEIIFSFTEVVKIEDIKLKDAILLEGLPGVGNVGKLAAMHLIEELKAKNVLNIFFTFSSTVLIDDDGVVKLVNNELYYHKGKKLEVVILVGEYQGMDSSGSMNYAVNYLARQRDGSF